MSRRDAKWLVYYFIISMFIQMFYISRDDDFFDYILWVGVNTLCCFGALKIIDFLVEKEP